MGAASRSRAHSARGPDPASSCPSTSKAPEKAGGSEGAAGNPGFKTLLRRLLARLEQQRHDGVEVQERAFSGRLDPDRARTVEEESGRVSLEVGDLLPGRVITDQAGVGNLKFLDELPDRGLDLPVVDAFVVDADDRQAPVSVRLEELHITGDLPATGGAPGAPEGHDRDVLLDFVERDRLAVEVGQREVEWEG